jgi:hypothetical protein
LVGISGSGQRSCSCQRSSLINRVRMSTSGRVNLPRRRRAARRPGRAGDEPTGRQDLTATTFREVDERWFWPVEVCRAARHRTAAPGGWGSDRLCGVRAADQSGALVASDEVLRARSCIAVRRLVLPRRSSYEDDTPAAGFQLAGESVGPKRSDRWFRRGSHTGPADRLTLKGSTPPSRDAEPSRCNYPVDESQPKVRWGRLRPTPSCCGRQRDHQAAMALHAAHAQRHRPRRVDALAGLTQPLIFAMSPAGTSLWLLLRSPGAS